LREIILPRKLAVWRQYLCINRDTASPAFSPQKIFFSDSADRGPESAPESEFIKIYLEKFKIYLKKFTRMVVGSKRKRTSSSGKPVKRSRLQGASKSYGWGAPLTITVKNPKTELKYDSGGYGNNVPATGLVTLVSTVAQGAAPNERIGRRINWHSMECSMKFRHFSDADYLYSRIWFIYDRQPNGTLPTFTTIFKSAVPETILNTNFGHRFKILYSRGFCSSRNIATGVMEGNVQFTNATKIDLKGLTASFTGSTDSIGDIEKGAIYACVVSTDNNISSITCEERFFYYDM